MKSQPVIFELADTADERFDKPIEVLLVTLLAFAPLALGAVQRWSEAIVIALAAAMLLTLIAKLLVRPDVRFIWSWTYLPLAVFVGLVLLQLLPLPGAAVRIISPNTYLLRSELLSIPGTTDPARWMRLSFTPEATLTHLRLLLAACAVFVVAINVIRQMQQVRRVLAAITIIGTTVALVALAQNLTDAQRIYWLIPVYDNQASAGPFINHSHFAQFMNMSMGAALALLLLHLDQLPRHRHHATLRAEALTRPLTTSIWLLACAIVAMAVSVPLSLSRGGMIAMVIAGLISGVVLATRRGMKGRTWIFIGMALVMLAALLLGRWDVVFDRATSVADPNALGGRLEILRGTLDLVRQYPLFGTGLGTFAFVFPMYDTSTIAKIAEHAENEYAQVLAETGLAGFLCLSAFAAMIFGAYVRCVRSAPSPMGSAAVGLGFGLIAVLVHSATDFGQHIPANFALTAIVMALLVNLSHATRSAAVLPPREQVGARAARWPRLAAAAVTLVAVGVVGWGAVELLLADYSFAAARRYEEKLSQQGWSGSNLEFARLIDSAYTASRYRPRDPVYRFKLNYYRWQALARSQSFSSEEPVLPPDELGDAQRVVDELLLGTKHAPTYAMPYFLAGQLQRYVLANPNGEALIRRAHRLAPTNPATCVAVGVLAGEQEQWDQAVTMFQRALELSANSTDAVFDALLDRLNRPELALQLAGDDLEALRQLAEKLQERGTSEEIAWMARQRREQLVLSQAVRPDAVAGTLAEAATLRLRRDDPHGAIQLYRRALAVAYERNDWRLELARVLLSVGQTEQALNEARTVLRVSPGHREAIALIDSVPPAANSPPQPPQPTTASSPPSTQDAHPGFRF